MIEVTWNEMARSLFREAGDALILFEISTGRVVDANPMTEKLSQIPYDDLLKLTLEELIQPKTEDHAVKLRHAYQSTVVFHAKEGFQLRTKQAGSWIPVNVTVARLHVSPTMTLGLVTARDLREIHLAHERLKKIEFEMRRVLSSVSDCLWSAQILADGGWLYRYFSPIVRQITGREAADFIPGLESWRGIVFEDDLGAWDEMTQSLRAGRSVECEYRIRRPDGGVRWIRESVRVDAGSPSTQSPSLLLYGVVTDVTERRAMMDELEEAARAAEVANRAKSTFLALVSHEIRTPMTSILGCTEMLKDRLRLQENQPSEVQETLESISRSGQHLLDLLNDVLDLSRIEAGRMELQYSAVHLENLLEDILAISREPAWRKSLDYLIEIPAPLPRSISTDPTRLRQILINLINNAIKFTHDGSVRLRVERQAETLVFTVSDTGIGISPEHLPKLFQPFFQLPEGRSQSESGTGLGLAICLRLTEQLQGGIEAESQLGVGSRFIVRLPLVSPSIEEFGPMILGEQASSRDQDQDMSTISGPAYRVLIVDDHAFNLNILSLFLKKVGIESLTAGSGEEALELVSQHELNLILLDLEMPRMSGYETIRHLRESGATLPVIALTAHTIQEVGDRCRAAGFDGFLQKPVSVNTLRSELRRYLPARPTVSVPEHSNV